MNFATTATTHHADIAAPAGSSSIGVWLRSTLASVFATSGRPPAPRDRSREAAQVRTRAMSVRDTDPGFAADLFAAADRHELTQD